MKYDCSNCEYGQLNKDRDKNKKKYCKKCTVDSKDIYGKPSHFKDKKDYACNRRLFSCK